MIADRIEIVRQIMAEHERITREYPDWPHNQLEAVAIVAQELGDVAAGAIRKERGVDEYDLSDYQKQAIQLAARAVRLAIETATMLG